MAHKQFVGLTVRPPLTTAPYYSPLLLPHTTAPYYCPLRPLQVLSHALTPPAPRPPSPPVTPPLAGALGRSDLRCQRGRVAVPQGRVGELTLIHALVLTQAVILNLAPTLTPLTLPLTR